MADKNTYRYRNFVTELRALSARDERLYNFVWESLPLDALDDIKSDISAPIQAKKRGPEKREKRGRKRLPLEYCSYWRLKALGLPKQFHTEENMKAALADKNTNRYRTFVRDLRVLSVRDERFYKFVWERLLDIDNYIDGGCSVLMKAVGRWRFCRQMPQKISNQK